MTELPQEAVGALTRAADSVLAQGLLGALLLLSLAGNVALIWALVRCYRHGRSTYGGSYDV